MKDFFISYNISDIAWAEWVAWVLEENNYSVTISAWDFRPGGNIVLDINQAIEDCQKTIIILSEDYLKAKEQQAEWASTFIQDPISSERKLIPIKVAHCHPKGILGGISQINLIGLESDAAKDLILESLRAERRKPILEPIYPENYLERQTPTEVKFPGEIRGYLPRSGATKFVGRLEDMEALHNMIQDSTQEEVTSIFGMGGIGKTEMALQYARQFGAKSYGIVCWIQARDKNIASQIISFTETHFEFRPSKELEIEQQVIKCWERWPIFMQPMGKSNETQSTRISKNADSSVSKIDQTHLFPCLIILDDVMSFSDIRSLLPPQTDSRFRVLITSRHRFNRVNNFEIKVISEKSSLELLQSILKDERVQDQIIDAKIICKRLGYLPLALELVGHNLELDQNISFRDIQDELDEMRIDAYSLLKDEFSDNMTARLGVAEAFELSFQKLDNDVQNLAVTLSLFAATSIPWDIVETCFSEITKFDLRNQRKKLIQNSLIQIAETGKELYRLHPLIREYLQARCATSENADKLKRKYCSAILCESKQLHQDLTREEILGLSYIAPHIEESVNTWIKNFSSVENSILVCERIAQFHERQGFYSKAGQLYLMCYNHVQEESISDRYSIAKCLQNLCLNYQYQGRYSEAETYCCESLNLIRGLCKNEICTELADSINACGRLYASQEGATEKAEVYLEESLEIRNHLLRQGKDCTKNDYKELADNFSDLAYIYHQKGDYKSAQSALNQASNIYRKLEDKINMASTLSDLAAIYIDIALVEEDIEAEKTLHQDAELLLIESLKIKRDLFEENHPDIAETIHNLANLFFDKKEFNKAIELHQQALDIFRNLYENDQHPDISMSLENLANCYRAVNDMERAKDLYERSIAIAKSYKLEESVSRIRRKVNEITIPDS